ncbi:shikimate dehydrogenase [Reyranella sp. CPCC 100927]|uniref:shikimate dehydrogenase n=1 Tax=Reyranella sp. CPCC 100927 TaxID=2599616 RepID=UPI0011B44614|nr:shikimate dehydrogenase [Reyranella sp. CPCC 100927]TWT12850.1 shikimate dehydrogenase [Reyranella sp. CPCC 100927]
MMRKSMLVGLIGSNITNSLSPVLHEDAFATAGIAGHYHLMDVNRLKGRQLETLLAAARTAGFAAVNITQPFKEAVIPLLDEVSAGAQQVGAVNTVVIDPSSRLIGHNTDRSGFRRAFEETLGRDAAAGKPVLLLGAGGAGRAVAFALMDVGVERLMIYDTEQARAAALCADLIVKSGITHGAFVADPKSAARTAAGIVNATPIGMLGHAGMPIDDALVRSEQWVADVVYTPLETQFVARARAKGCRAMTGGAMCVHQAADAFQLFTGLVPDVRRMRRVFDEACAGRDAALAAMA